MKEILLTQLIKIIMGMLTPELLRKFADATLDFIEDYVAGTASEIDDNLILPLCSMIRTAFDIKDND